MTDIALSEVLDDVAIRRVRELLGHRDDAVVTVGDGDGRLLWASAPGSEELFGRRPDAFAGHTRFDYVHEEDRGRARRHYARALDGETVRYTVRVHTADGTWVPISSVAWGVSGTWGRAVVTITTPAAPDAAWPPIGVQR